MKSLFVALLLVVSSSRSSAHVLDDNGYGPLRMGVRFTVKLLRKAFPGATVEAVDWDGDGETLHGFEVMRGGKKIAHALDPEVLLFDPALRTSRGLGVGSTYEAIKAVYPAVTCDKPQMEVDGSEGAVVCSSPHSVLVFAMDSDAGWDTDDECKRARSACCGYDGPCNDAALRGSKVIELRLDLTRPKK